jgi:glycosyltransferase involved in cell wall biosynthesis
MRIGLNLLYMIPGQVGGTETYAAGLLHGLARSEPGLAFDVYLNREAAEWPLPEGGDFRRIVCNVRGARRAERYAYEQSVLPLKLSRRSTRLVHSLGYVCPAVVSCRSVVTVHDLNFREFGDRMPRARRLALEIFVRLAVTRSDHIIAVSRFTRDLILAHYQVREDKVTAIHSGLGKPPRRGAPANPGPRPRQEPYLIAFSSSSPNKNLGRLIQGFLQARQQFELPHRLVLVGHRPPDALLGGVLEGDRDAAVDFTGYLDDGVLEDTLRGAELLVFASTYEGFGLPVAEAMAVGVPVACSNAASLPEVAGDAALFFDPYSVDAIAGRIGQLARDPELRDRMREKGYRNVQRFSWAETARATSAIYRKLLGAGPAAPLRRAKVGR